MTKKNPNLLFFGQYHNKDMHSFTKPLHLYLPLKNLFQRIHFHPIILKNNFNKLKHPTII